MIKFQFAFEFKWVQRQVKPVYSAIQAVESVQNAVFPIRSLEFSKKFTKLFLWLKFCWKFRSNQSSFIVFELYILFSWIASLYFIIWYGFALLFISLCFSYDNIGSGDLSINVNSITEVPRSCCFDLGSRFGVRQISQL